MKPIPFNEINCTYQGPKNGELGNLDAYKGDGEVISKWKMTWRERLQVLLRGTVWVHALGEAIPPITLETYKTPFELSVPSIPSIPPMPERRGNNGK